MKSIELLNKLLDGREDCEVERKDSLGNYISAIIKKNPSLRNYEGRKQLIDRMPEQYMEFLSFSDGMELFNYDDLDGVKLLSLEEIEIFTDYGKSTFEEEWEDNILIFAKIIGEDNYLGFRISDNSYEVIDCYFEDVPSEWSVIADGFDGFLEKYLTENGDKYWIF